MNNRLTPIDWLASRIKHHVEDGFSLTADDLKVYLDEAKTIRTFDDPIVEQVISKYNTRSTMGILKYGTTLDDSNASFIEWLNHLQEELMDATLYIEKLKSKLRE